MQTFLPYPSFYSSAYILDKKRVWKQTVEAFQIINCLEGKSTGWKNHPAVKMWDGHVEALKLYYNLFLDECVINRKIKVTKLVPKELGKKIELPKWFGDNRLHSSHRSNLLRKDEKYYGQFGWAESKDLPYWWPK